MGDFVQPEAHITHITVSNVRLWTKTPRVETIASNTWMCEEHLDRIKESTFVIFFFERVDINNY